MIKCPNCTGEMKFSAKDQIVKCEYCGSTFDPKELNVEVKKSKEKKSKEEVEEKEKKEESTLKGTSYSCTQCGATLMTFDETAITFCSYCGSQNMMEDKMMTINNPDYIIPFSKTKDECIAAYKSKIKKALFAPSYMKSDVVVEKFRGIYMPYGIYKMENHGNVSNKGSKYSHRSGNYEYYDDYRIDANVDASYDGVSYDLLSKFYDKYSTAIPFNTKEKEEFNPNYLVGFYADASDVSKDVYDRDALNVVEEDASAKMGKYKEFSKYGCSNPKAKLNVTDRKVGMFPVYFLAIRDKKNQNINYAIVNGQTGQVAADIPIDFKKYIIASLILAVIIFLLIDSKLVLTPKVVCVISAIIAVICAITIGVQLGKIKERKAHLDDKGYRSINKDIKKVKGENAFLHMYKTILAVVIPIIALFSNAVDDKFYYSAAVISLGLVVLSFRNIVKEHNIMVSNALPQLEKRGGEE